MAAGRHTPDPREARTPAEFLAALQALKERSGLTYRELSSRAEARGDVLPRSTVANMLTRATLPREELLAAFVRACGATPDELTEWRRARTELAGRGTDDAAGDVPDGGDGGSVWTPGAKGRGSGQVPEAVGDVPDTGECGPGQVSEAVGDVPDSGECGFGQVSEAVGDVPDTGECGFGQVSEAAGNVPATERRDFVRASDTGGHRPVHTPEAADSIPDRPEPVGPPPSWPGGEDALRPPGDASGAPARIGRALVAAVAVTGLVLAGFSVLALLRGGGTGHAGLPPRTSTAALPAAVAPVAGDVRIRVAGTGFCLGERRGTRSGQVHQVPCAGTDFPRYSLAPAGAGRWRIVSDHPDFGPGCSGIPSGGRISDAAYEDSECGDPSRVESFALEAYAPAGGAVRGYRIVPVGSATPGACVTVVGDRAAAWAKLIQAPCTPDAAGQLFSFERRN
ncbi:helix-turn-helix transcriptional regulator [Streptomyces venezuelae]|uniref:helix-turn-helix transcriptional regulator n=1 Tax=Streptomyces sp. B6(2022) TaxID=3404749 RepID=UPI00311F8437